MSLALKKALMKMFNAEKKTSHIFRAFLNANYEQSLLGNNNADTLLHSEKLALKSFRGKVFSYEYIAFFYNIFTFSLIDQKTSFLICETIFKRMSKEKFFVKFAPRVDKKFG